MWRHKHPCPQMQWLTDTLNQSRSNGKNVLILGHIPPGGGESTSLYNDWFLSVLGNNTDIIQASFFGHSHNDQFYLFDNKKITPSLISPSLLPDSRDPCFRIYEYDSASGKIIDYTQYCIDMEVTNSLDSLQVYIDYQASQLYNISKIDAQNLHDLYTILQTNKSHAITYCNHYFGYRGNSMCTDSQIQDTILDIFPLGNKS